MPDTVCVPVDRFLGVLVVFMCGAVLSFLFTVVVLHRRGRQQEAMRQQAGGYELVNGQKSAENPPS